MRHRPRARVGLLAGTVLWLCHVPALAHTDITAPEAHDMITSGQSDFVLDVREYSEFCGPSSHIEDAVNLPWNTAVLQDRFAELPADATIIVVCASGNRSNMASNFLDAQGFTAVHDMLGGMNAWSWPREPCDVEPILGLSRTGSVVELNWTPTPGSQDYDLLRGDVEELTDAGLFIELGPTDCLAEGSPFTYGTDADWIPPGAIHFFLARQKNGSWGESSADSERSSASTCE